MKVRQRLARRLERPHVRAILRMARLVRRAMHPAVWPGPAAVVLPLRGSWMARPVEPEDSADAHLSGLLREGAL